MHRLLSFPVPRAYLAWALIISFAISALDLFAPLETFRFLATIPFRDRLKDGYTLVEERHGFDKLPLNEQRLVLANALIELDKAGAKRILINGFLDQPSTVEADHRLGDVIARLRRPLIAPVDVFADNDGILTEQLTCPPLIPRS